MKLSCLIPHYNDADMLSKSIRALLGQNIDSMEILILDDGSTDQNWHQIKKLLQLSPLIKIKRNKENIGAVKTSINGLKLVQGEFIYMGSSNDFVLPGFFEAAISTLEQFPEIGFFCGSAWLDHQGIRSLSNLGWGKQERLFLPEDLVQFHRKIPCSFHGQSVVLRRSYLFPPETLSSNLKGNFDLFIFFSLAMEKGFYYTPKALSLISISPHSFSAQEQLLRQKIIKIESYLETMNNPIFTNIKKKMIKSGLLSFLGIGLICCIIKKRKWEYISLKLIKDIFVLIIK